MITPMQMYWLVKLDDIRSFLDGLQPVLSVLTFLAFGCGIAFTAIYMFAGNGSYDMFAGTSNEKFEEIRSAFRAWRGRVFCLAVLGLVFAMSNSFLFHMLPTTKQMAAVIVVPRVVNNEKMQMAGNKLYDLAVEWMDELRPKKANKPTTPPATGKK